MATASQDIPLGRNLPRSISDMVFGSVITALELCIPISLGEDFSPR
jgi:hypothetical protein